MSIHNEAVDAAEATMVDGASAAQQAVDLMLSVMSDKLDHPELWALVPTLAAENPEIRAALLERTSMEQHPDIRLQIELLLGLFEAAAGAPEKALDTLMPLCAAESQNVQVQGVLFYIESLLDPQNPKFRLAGKVCTTPFTELDVLTGSTHLCCAGYLPTATGNLSQSPWQQAWNGATAQAIRESVFDGTYRFCNKRTCPKIQSNQLQTAQELKADTKWRDIVRARETKMLRGPEKVNLAYDRTCNLSCPSCRTSRYAADAATRARFDVMQEEQILPLLTGAKSVFVTGSGDPFASKNFRALMKRLDAKFYPDLRFIIMTNGMLFTQNQWSEFPSLHGRVESLRISLDAATRATHEKLRRGSQWSIMEKNLRFAGDLAAQGLVDDFSITFTVQVDNYREMGDAVDLVREIGANTVCFARLTNWGTFTAEEYLAKAVFIPGHPEYEDFLRVCGDPRLSTELVSPGDLDDFIVRRI